MKHKADNKLFQSTICDLRGQSDEEMFLNTIGAAALQFTQNKEKEVTKWKNAYMQEALKTDYLIKLLKANNIPVPDLTYGKPFETPILIEKPEPCFYDLIQGDKEKILKMLHYRIDGHGGKDVACILLKAKDESIISRLPKEKEFKSEFKKATGAWRSISTYLNPNKKPDYSSVTLE